MKKMQYDRTVWIEKSEAECEQRRDTIEHKPRAAGLILSASGLHQKDEIQEKKRSIREFLFPSDSCVNDNIPTVAIFGL